MAKPSLPPFFKVLKNDFSQQLKLPPYLLLKYGNILPKHVKLRISNGVTRDVKIHKQPDGKYCLTRGWSEFVKDFKLVEEDYVCFYPCIDGLTLDVVVFGSDCYEKKMQVLDEDGEDSGTDSDISPHFEIEFRKRHTQRMPLSKKFVDDAHLFDNKRVMMEYVPKKYTLEVALDKLPNRHSFKFDLVKDWKFFQEGSEMEVGNTYSFTFNPVRKVIEVTPSADRKK